MGKNVELDFLPPPLKNQTFERTFRDRLLPAAASPPGATTVVSWLDIIDEAMCLPEQPPLLREMAQLLIQDVLNGHVPVDTLLEQVTKRDGTVEAAVPYTSWLDIIDETLSELSREMGYLELRAEAHSLVQGILHKQVDIKCLLHPVTQPKSNSAFFQETIRISNDLTEDDIFQAVEARLLNEQPYWSDYFDPAAISFAGKSLVAGTIYVTLYYQGQVPEVEATWALNNPPLIFRPDNIPPVTQAIILINPIRVPLNQNM